MRVCVGGRWVGRGSNRGGWKRGGRREWDGGGKDKDKGKVKRKKASDSRVRLNLPCRFAAAPPPRRVRFHSMRSLAILASQDSLYFTSMS